MFYIELRDPRAVDGSEGKLLYKTKIAYSLKLLCNKVGYLFFHSIWNPHSTKERLSRGCIKPLYDGLYRLKKDASYYKSSTYCPGYNDYNNLVKFTEELLAKCKEFNTSKIITYEMSKPEM